MKNTLAVVGLIIFTVYLCSRELPPKSDCVSNLKEATLTSTAESIEMAEIEKTNIGKTSTLTKNEPKQNRITHDKPMHNHLAVETKSRNPCIEKLKAEHRDEDNIKESLSNSKRGLAMARATESFMKSRKQPQLSSKARISRLPGMGLTPIRRNHRHPEVAFQEMTSANFEGTAYVKKAPSSDEQLASSAAASSGARGLGVEGEANRATAINKPNEKCAPADEPTSPNVAGPSQVIADNAEWPTRVSRPEQFSDLRNERELGDIPTLGGNAQNTFDAAAVSDIYGAEVTSALFEVQAHYQVPNTGAVAGPPNSNDGGPTEEPIQGAVSEPANAGIHLTAAQAEDYNRASAEANNTRNPFDSDDEDADADEANDNISQAGAAGMQDGVPRQDSTGPAFLAQPASTFIVEPLQPAMTAASAAPIKPEQRAINLSPEQLQEYNQVSFAAFNAPNPFDSDEEDDEPLPSTVGSTAQNASAESQSKPAQTHPMATHASQTVPAPTPIPTPTPAPASAAAPVNCRMIFPDTDPLPQLATAPSAAPIRTWHNTAPVPIVAVSAPILQSYNNGNAPPLDAAFYSADDSSCMIWEHSNPTPMDWDTATSIHLSNPPGRIITIGGFDIEMGTLTEFREVRGANTRLDKKGRRRQQQQFLDCRAGLKKKESLEMAEGKEGGRRKRVCKKSGRGRRQGGEGRMGEEAEEDSPMTLF